MGGRGSAILCTPASSVYLLNLPPFRSATAMSSHCIETLALSPNTHCASSREGVPKASTRMSDSESMLSGGTRNGKERFWASGR